MLDATGGSPIDRELRRWIAYSAALHVAFFAGWFLFESVRSPPAAPENFVTTRLVKLGKKRDEKLLPRLDQKPAPPPPAPAPKPEKKVEPAPAPKPEKKVAPTEPKRSASEILKNLAQNEKSRDLSSLIEKRIGPSEDEGDPEGSALGDEITGRIQASYNDKLLGRLKGNLAVPSTVNDKERLRLRAVLEISIGADGSLLSARIVKASDNKGFDNAVLSAAKKSAPYPNPPPTARKFYERGVQMNVCPISCK